MVYPRNSVTVNTHDNNNPYGLRAARIFTSSLMAVAFPLNQRKQAYEAYPRIKEVGTYILIDNDTSTAYIGKSGELEKRIDRHARRGKTNSAKGTKGAKIRKEDDDDSEVSWSEAIVLTSDDSVLNESHIGYIEMCLIELARANPFWDIENDNDPANKYDHFDEFIKKNLEDLVNQAKKILPPIGCNLFREISDETSREKDEATPSFHYKGKDFEAKMHIIDGNFVVLKGSKARVDHAPRAPQRLIEKRQKLIKGGILNKNENYLVFERNCAFSSLTAAAQVVSGQSVSGQSCWKTGTGGKTTYKEWEAKLVRKQQR